MSGGDKPPAQIQRELNYCTKEESLEATTKLMVVAVLNYLCVTEEPENFNFGPGLSDDVAQWRIQGGGGGGGDQGVRIPPSAPTHIFHTVRTTGARHERKPIAYALLGIIM